MKPTLTLLLFTFIAFQVSAQSGLNNLSFENWNSTNTITGNTQPKGFISFGQEQNTTDPVEGSIGLKMKTVYIDTTIFTNTFQDTIGTSLIGNINTTTQDINVGTPYPSSLPGCPDSIVGYMRYDLPNQDTASILSQVKDSNGDTIATAKAHYGGTQSSWTKFTIEFDPIDCGGMKADSIGLLFTSETVGYDQYVQGLADRGTQTVGGEFELDGVKIHDSTKTVSLNELVADKNSKRFSLMPNPARDKIRFEHGSLEERVRIFDMTGRNVRNVQLGNGNSEEVSVSGMDEGLYIYRVEGKNGQQLHSGKLQVIH